MCIEVNKVKAKRIYLHYGPRVEWEKLQEESLELSHAVQNVFQARGSIDDIIEEVADVLITIEHFKLSLIPSELKQLQHMIDFKLDRQIERIRKEKENAGENH